MIGAGVAGLAAASALAEAGRRVVVLEARGELGGRATAFRDRETGELVDNGQHVLFGCYHETFRFLRRIGAEANLRVQPALEVPYLDLDARRLGAAMSAVAVAVSSDRRRVRMGRALAVAEDARAAHRAGPAGHRVAREGDGRDRCRLSHSGAASGDVSANGSGSRSRSRR